MASRRALARRRGDNGNGGRHPFYEAFHHAYSDALYARIIERLEDGMKDPAIRDILDRYTDEMAAAWGRLLQRQGQD